MAQSVPLSRHPSLRPSTPKPKAPPSLSPPIVRSLPAPPSTSLPEEDWPPPVDPNFGEMADDDDGLTDTPTSSAPGLDASGLLGLLGTLIEQGPSAESPPDPAQGHGSGLELVKEFAAASEGIEAALLEANPEAEEDERLLLHLVARTHQSLAPLDALLAVTTAKLLTLDPSSEGFLQTLKGVHKAALVSKVLQGRMQGALETTRTLRTQRRFSRGGRGNGL